ncbi:MAG TPA: AAA family ATPase [Solirubrobacteraceae bacterium]|nr:AAA family ATPase [Solirubrobacteraceae bacterium]
MPDASPPRAGTRIQLCGRLSVELDGSERVHRLRGRQVPLLLTYLVLNRGRPVGREELIGALWPGTAPRSQDAALRTLLSRLRSALGSEALHGRDELELTLPEPVWIDLEAAVDHVERAEAALAARDAKQAWGLAQVPLNVAGRGLLPGSAADWIDRARRDLEDIRLRALEVVGRAGLLLGSGQLASVERAARALLDAEPYRESGYVLLMSALQRQGNVAEGLRVFERLRTLLRDELGTAPSPEALAAHQRLLTPAAQGAGGAEAAPDARAVALPLRLLARAAPPLIGRETQLAEITGWLQQAGSRAERVLLLAGDAGVGKTRLLAEVAVRAHAQGATVLAGRAADEALIPFQPFLDALGPYVQTLDQGERDELVHRHGPELARLIPELRRRLVDQAPPPAGDSETERYRLFEAVVDLLADLSVHSPVVLVLDDLHWADRPTLMLLRHLARDPRLQSVSILGAFRASDRDREGFGAALGGLRDERIVRLLEIGGLDRSEATQLVGLHAGALPSAALAQALYEETGGNPFFIEEMVRHLVDSGVQAATAGAHELHEIGLPDDVQELIGRRLSRLGEPVVEILRLAAVIGREFDAGLLEAILEPDEEAFLSALEEAVASGLVVEDPTGPERYAFTHALVRETLYGGMSAPRRARWHRRVGIALEQAGAEAQIGALARHFTRAAQAQDAERAVRYALAAAEQAATMLAHDQAAEHLESALSVLDRFAPADRARRLALLLELGEARIRCGERPRAWGVFREAATVAAELSDAQALARAAVGASRRYVLPPGVVDSDLIALLEQALAAYPSGPSVLRVQLLFCLCSALYFSDRRDEMRRLSAEATVIASELGDPRGLAFAAAARRRAYWGPGHLERRLADSTQLLRAALQAGDRGLVLQGHAWLVVDLLETGDRVAVETQIDAFDHVAHDLRQPLFQWQVLVWRAMQALMAGRLDAAETLAGEALASGVRPEGITAPQYYAIQILVLRREQARLSELEAAARALTAQSPDRPAWRAALAVLLCESGRRQEAAAELEALAVRGFADIPLDGDWLITVTLLTEAIFALGDAERARRLYELLLPYRNANVVIGLAAVCLGSTARYLGRLAATMGDTEGARAHLEHAIRANAALEAPVMLAHAQLDYAAIDPASPRARELVHAAAEIAERLGLPAVAQRAAALR